MSTIGITTDLISQVAGMPSAADQFVTDLNRLAHDLQDGDPAVVQADYVLFSESVLTALGSVPLPSTDQGVTTSLSSSADSAKGANPGGAVANPAVPQTEPAPPAEHTGPTHAPTPVASPSVSATPGPSLSLHA